MSGGMPELGSKISLISKADIRYEGRLFTVNPEECTIALANVRSFGTEDRETHCPIACQNQIYDYILFRGSDIKDIRVVNSVPIPNDPAIMQMHLPSNQMVQPNYQPQGFPMQSMNHMGGPPMNQFNPYGHGQMGNLGGLAPGSLQGVSKKQPSELNYNIPSDLAEHKDQASVLDLIGGGSRSTTPVSLISRKSPTADMGVQTNQANTSGQNREKKSNNQVQIQQRNNNQRERHDSGKIDNYNNQNDKFNNNNNNNNINKQNQRMNNNNNNQSNQNNRGWVNRGNNNMQMRGNRTRGRGGPPQQAQGYRQGGENNAKPGSNRNKNTLKFENDFDFEQANTKFEEIRSQLAKLKVAGEEVVKPEQVNGEVDKKDDSGNETGAGDHEQEDEEVCYDKTKSFFDTISCEAVERSKGKTQRTDWRQERKLNSETFGVSSTRRGGFRGRGGYFNRGSNLFRGNYRGNFRGRNSNGNINNNNNNRNNVQNAGNMPQRNQQTIAQVVAGK